MNRTPKGQFVKGVRSHPATEFKPGQTWREPKPCWNKDWMQVEYVEKNRSAIGIAKQCGVTENAILYWLHKHGIPRRTVSQVRAKKHWGNSGKSNPMYGKRGAEVANWKGGCTPERQALYNSLEWAFASKAVWKRDKGECQRCASHVGHTTMHIHHIVSFSVKELRAEVSNLVLLCSTCHRFVHSRKNVNSEFIKKEVRNDN